MEKFLLAQKIHEKWDLLCKSLAITLHKKAKFSIKNLFNKCNQIRRKMRIWPRLLKKSLIKNFIFCAF